MEYIRTKDVKRVLLGVPRGHRHLRLALELRDGRVIILSEATVASIVRAFVTLYTHPSMRALELVGSLVADRKPGYAEYQLLESGKSPDSIEKELSELLSSSSPQDSGSTSTAVP